MAGQIGFSTGEPVGAQQGDPVPVAAVAAGDAHTCAVLAGAVACAGYNLYGQLGDGTSIDAKKQVGVVGIANAVSIGAGFRFNCAIIGSGSVRCWGTNSNGQLGNGTTVSSSTPVAVSGMSTATTISGGGSHACAIVGTGGLRCWGENVWGQLGNGTTSRSTVPVTVTGITSAVSVSAGHLHSCAVLATGGVRCWGANSSGQLGNGTTTTSSVPVAVTGITDAVSVSAGSTDTCAVLQSGGVRCWGSNSNGKLGNGTTTNSSVPVVVSGITNAEAVSAGHLHTCAVLATGGMRCWGYNSYGQVGNGTTTGTESSPVVVGLTDATTVTVGDYHTCATFGSGSLSCWGYNGSGQLGDGTTVNRSLPTPVASGLCQASPNPGFTDVPAGAYFEFAVSWLVGRNITEGTGPGLYSPNAAVTRKNMAVFLWRAAGSPAGSPTSGLTDVPSGSYYEVAVNWLVAKGISTGTSPGKFSPNAVVTRKDMAVFLWRASSKLAAAPHSFSDVAAGSYYNAAVAWLAEVGISGGTSPGKFSPNNSVTRAQMALFLYRRGCGVSA
ncbi:MAG: S-layer homology domain-containing protein [Microthrixaceae bacterium]